MKLRIQLSIVDDSGSMMQVPYNQGMPVDFTCSNIDVPIRNIYEAGHFLAVLEAAADKMKEKQQ